MKKIEIACIVDDDPIFIFVAKRLMALSSFCDSFLIFRNGREAIEGLKAIVANREKLPEIILLDINMPVMDGWEFLDEFVKLPVLENVHIYIATSSVDPADIERAREYSFVSNYLVKPVTIASLREILENNQAGTDSIVSTVEIK